MCDVGQRVSSTFSENMLPDDQLSLNDWRNVIDDVARFKPLIAITSTEPLLYPDLVPLIEHCHSRGLKVQVTTNGFLLPSFASAFLDCELDVLAVSIDGPPQLHDKIRGVEGSFDRASKNIRFLMDLRKNQKPFIYMNFTVCDLNFNRITDTLPHVTCDRFTVSHLNFVTQEMAEAHNEKCPFKVTACGLHQVSLDRIGIYDLWQQIQQVKASKTRFPVTFGPDLSFRELAMFYREPTRFLPRHTRCHAVWNVGQIMADGTVTGCTRCFARLGNVKDEAFTKLWNGPLFQQFRRSLLDAGRAFPACSRCCGLL